MLMQGEIDVLCGEIEEDMPTYGWTSSRCWTPSR